VTAAGTRVVLVRPLQSGNVGSVARAMANFGLSRWSIVQAAAFDPDQARWMAPGAHELVDRAQHCATIAQALDGATVVLATTTRQRRWRGKALDPEQAAERLLDAGEGGAVLFGPEDAGLSAADLKMADGLVTIETGGLESLNVSHAAVVVFRALFESARRRGIVAAGRGRQRSRGGAGKPRRGAVEEPVAEVGLRTALIEDAVRAVQASGYVRGRSIEQIETTLFDLLSRARPTEREARMLRGMVKRVAEQR
jgi:tRNA (cytidine32/uridine32-2'-O)-methyltransferase